MTKQEQAIQIVKNNANKSRKDVIAIIREQLGMTDAGASTYFYNAQKKLGAAEQTSAVNEQLKEEVSKQKPINTKENASAAHAKASNHGAPERVWSEDELREAQKAQMARILSDINLDDIPAFLKKGL